MITTGIIRQINLSSSSYVCNKYLIELNIFQVPGDYNKSNYTYQANCSTLPGHYDSYEVGDKVYVGFINDDLSLPIILGRIYQGHDDISRSYINCQNLNVSNSVRLPKDIKIGDISYTQLLKLFNKESKKYYNHFIKCALSNGFIAKFKFINTSNCSYFDQNLSAAYLNKELFRLNADCSFSCDVYEIEADSGNLTYRGIYYARYDAQAESIGINIDSTIYTITEILEDAVIEI